MLNRFESNNIAIAKTSNKITFFNVLVTAPIDRTYTYVNRTGIDILPGQIVRVKFGARDVIGIVWSQENSSDRSDLKEIDKIYEYPPVPQSTLDFIDSVARYNIADRGSILRMVLSEPTLFKEIKKKATDPVFSKSAPTEILLGKEQAFAASTVCSAVDQNIFSAFCLHGVTGSGKTETYLKVCKHAISQGKQCLIMLPEISLTPQLIERFKKYFGSEPLIWHSSVTPKNRRNVWLKALNCEANIVIAARSGLFLPFGNLGIIVVDEEHDSSYKQEDGTIYNARDMAVLRAKILKIPIILSSATPSIETVNNCIIKKYERLRLTSRFSGILMPEFKLIDMRKNNNSAVEWLSDSLTCEIKNTIQSGKQALLYINKRGYAPLTLCRKCGYRVQCPNCTSWLVEHKKFNLLTCHYCNHQIPKTDTCPKCNEKSLFAYGVGVERIQQELTRKLPEAISVIASSDTIPTVGKMQKLYDDILACKYNVIIGTQIFSKGHHFPNILLVGVIDTDSGLMGSDPRAAERTYQTIQQVSGRAGRVDIQGKVLLQTYNPDNPFYKLFEKQDYDNFFETEIRNRKLSNIPPYSKLAAIILSSNNPKEVEDFAETIVRLAPIESSQNLQILGPIPAILTKLSGRTRWRILLRSASNYNLQEYIRSWLKAIKIPTSVKLNIDIDPYNFA